MTKDKIFDYGFMSLGVLLQVICFILTKDDILSFICGLSGVINVVLCSQRKMSFYLFAYIQMFTYIIIIYQNKLWGELGENIFYLVTTTVALFLWKKNYNKEENVVEAKKFTNIDWVITGGVFILATFIFVIGTIIVLPIITEILKRIPVINKLLLGIKNK